MVKKLVHFIFFGNYFVGLLAVALSIECSMQLNLPFNSFPYYLLLFIVPTVYYTYAYRHAGADHSSVNPRTQWYRKHIRLVKSSQMVLSFVSLVLMAYIGFRYYEGFLHLPLLYWLGIGAVLLAAVLYYGLLPRFIFKFNLRNTGWIKAFIIGFVWACCANVLPLIMLKAEKGIGYYDPYIWSRLFIKNLMFCTVNAIMFDIKDYPTDANLQLRTFVVRFGLRRTIYFILIPLTIVGMLSLCVFARLQHFPPLQLAFNLLPFIGTIWLAYSLHKRRSILFYLMIIDGLILFKAICGILAVLFIRYL